MKKFFAIAAFVCCSIVSFGQNKGDMSLTTSLNFEFSNGNHSGITSSSTYFGIGAGANYFVIDNLSVGLNLNYVNSNGSHFFINPSVAYYIGICDNLYYRPSFIYDLGIEEGSVSHTFILDVAAFEYRVREHFAVTASVLDLRLSTQSNGITTFGFDFSWPSVGIIFYL